MLDESRPHRRATTLAVVITYYQEVAESVHSFVLKGGMKVRERFHEL